MTAKVANIRRLALDEVAGTLSPKDREHLYKAIAHDKESFAVWKEIQECFANPTTQEMMAKLPEKLPLEQVMLEIQNVKTKRVAKIARMSLVGVAAASILGVMAIYWFKSGENLPAPDYTLQPTKDRIELQLPNGNKVDLSQDREQQVAGLSLTSKQGTLHYSTINKTLAGSASLHIPAGKDYKITLNDGTEVWLNSTTTLHFPLSFSDNSREVTINGEAYFKVARDAQKPFLVHLPYGTVTVLGTEFNVNTYDSGRANVSLVQGKVAMKVEADSLVLKPGYEIAYQQHKGMQIRSFDPEILSWRQGVFVFNDTRLEDVMKIVPRWYGIPVVFDNTELKSKRLFGIIERNEPIQELMNRLKLISKVDYYIDKNGLIHIK